MLRGEHSDAATRANVQSESGSRLMGQFRTKLHKILYSSKYRNQEGEEKILRRINWNKAAEYPTDPVMLEVEFIDDCGRIPLHIACQDETRASYKVVDALIKAFPGGVKMGVQPSRDLPLHTACNPMCRPRGQDGNREGNELVPVAITGGSDLERIILRLTKEYPRAVLFNSGGGTALHSILEHRPCLRLVRSMVELAEEERVGLDKKVMGNMYEDGNVKFRTDVRLVQRRDLETNQLPLHVAIERHAPSDVILFLIDQFPDSVGEAGSCGFLPLHSAMQRGCTRTVLKRLLSGKHVSALVDKTNDWGNTPLHWLFDLEEYMKRQDGADGEGFGWPVHPDEEVEEYEVISGAPHNILSPYQTACMSLRRYYDSLCNPPLKYSIHLMPRSKKKKRSSSGLSHKQALRKIKSLVETNRNAEKMSVLQLAERCHEMFPQAFPQKLICFLRDVASGLYDFQGEEESDEEEGEEAPTEREDGSGLDHRPGTNLMAAVPIGTLKSTTPKSNPNPNKFSIRQVTEGKNSSPTSRPNQTLNSIRQVITDVITYGDHQRRGATTVTINEEGTSGPSSSQRNRKRRCEDIDSSDDENTYPTPRPSSDG